jgi:hypothetical protein
VNLPPLPAKLPPGLDPDYARACRLKLAGKPLNRAAQAAMIRENEKTETAVRRAAEEKMAARGMGVLVRVNAFNRRRKFLARGGAA